jgi:signal peptidase I
MTDQRVDPFDGMARRPPGDESVLMPGGTPGRGNSPVVAPPELEWPIVSAASPRRRRGAGKGRRRKAKPSPLRSAVEWVAVIGGALVIALLIRTYLFANFWIPSASMRPTLMEQDRVVVNKLSYKIHDVHRGDIIVFEKPPGEPEVTANGRPVKDLIKRVIGLPGEKITIKSNHVFINGRQLAEPYLPAGTTTDGRTCGTDIRNYQIPAKSIFVMGDNRGDSRDSRCFTHHAVSESLIVGRAFARIWPVSKIGRL